MKNNEDSAALKALKAASSSGNYRRLYLFYGEEQYLLQYYLERMRKDLVTPGTEEFNHKRFIGKKITPTELSQAMDALPAFSEHTLIEISDFDLFDCDEDSKLSFIEVLSDIPDWACIVFIFDALPFKPDMRVNVNKALRKLFETVEFTPRNQSDLISWITRRFKALGKDISSADASYLAFISGGLMTALITEIEKIAAYEKSNTVRRKSIDAVVTPVLDAVVYKMTDALLQKKFDAAAGIISTLLRMQEAPHMIVYSISLKMRQLLAARILCEAGLGVYDLQKICDIKIDYPAKGLITAAQSATPEFCRYAVNLCCNTALALNSGSSADLNGALTQLLMELAAAAEAF